VTRHEQRRLDDIRAAIEAIRSHLTRGELSDGLIFDAVRVRLIEIGEAVKGLHRAFLANEDTIPWDQLAAMRDRLAHRYFDTSRAVLQATVEHDLPELEQAIERLRARAADE
jgi:uncharacterized protein with HEPN domain